MDKQGRKFAAFDIDGTLIRWQLYHAIADKLVSLGFIAPVKFQAIKDARMVWKRRENTESFKQYEMKLVEIYGEILAEVSEEQFEKAAQAAFDEYKDQVYTYTRSLLKELKTSGYVLLAISGSQSQVISKMAEYYGFDDFVAKQDKYENGRFVGQGTTPIFNKDKVLKDLVSRHELSFEQSIAVGDSASDIKMLELVEQPVAFNPEKELFDHAKAEGWKIVIERKNMVYELNKAGKGYELA